MLPLADTDLLPFNSLFGIQGQLALTPYGLLTIFQLPFRDSSHLALRLSEQVLAFNSLFGILRVFVCPYSGGNLLFQLPFRDS